MGTRGAIGFRIDGQDKVTYNHFDSYPTGVGDEVMQVVRRRKSDERMKSQARKIELVLEGEKFNPLLLKKVQKKISPNTSVGNQSIEDPYCVLRGAQGQLDKYLDIGVMIDNHDFLLDSLFCEWAYIVNLDTGMLEVYRGFNTTAGGKGRYASEMEPDRGHRPPEYYGVELIGEIPLASIRKMTKKQVENLCGLIEAAVCNEGYEEDYEEEHGEKCPTLEDAFASIPG